MRIAIIEDSAAEAELLREEINQLEPLPFPLTEVTVYESGEAFLGTGEYYDLLFIDCLLPGMTGVELAKQIRQVNKTSMFIFVTANIEYAAEGYETNALRYLLKPVDGNKLREALLCYATQTQNDPIIELTGTKRRPVYTKTSQIVYIESAKREVIVRLEDKTVSSQKTIKELEEAIKNTSFCRTQRGFLVNLRWISRKDGDTLIMSNGERVCVSRRRRKEFNNAFVQYLKQS